MHPYYRCAIKIQSETLQVAAMMSSVLTPPGAPAVCHSSNLLVKPFSTGRPIFTCRSCAYARHSSKQANRYVQQQRQQNFSSQCQRLVLVRSFEGAASKELKEAAALDELIDMMLAAKSQQEVSCC
jgi:hypothetical protein